MFSKSECFDYNGAAKIIEAKGILDEIREIIAQLDRPAGRVIQGLLGYKGWFKLLG